MNYGSNSVKFFYNKLIAGIVFVLSSFFPSFYGYSYFMSINEVTVDINTFSDYLSILFLCFLLAPFCLGSVIAFYKIFTWKPELVISDEGIYDNSGVFAMGFIPWSAVVAVEDEHMANSIKVYINPDLYNQKSRSLMRWIGKSVPEGVNASNYFYIQPRFLWLGKRDIVKIISTKISQ